jgi:nucleotide-binding universal stress UspA family protein
MQVRRILVPVDGSELTARAIEASVGLARQLGATIVGFVAETPPPAWSRARPDRGASIAGDLDDDEDALIGPARPALARFETAARAAGVGFEGVTERVPRVAKAIIAAAESHRCDLIVMVTHGRGAFGEFLFGSQTKAVLAGSRLPLLVLH